MIRNYIVIALRNFWKHKLFSVINVFGLASGMAICLLALMQIKSAFEYDQFHPHPDRTYRIISDVTDGDGNKNSYAMSPLPLGDYLKQQYSFIEQSTRVYYGLRGETTVGNKTIYTTGAFADASFFSVFGFRLSSGRPAVEPYTVVLTPETAHKFFGLANPVGKMMKIQDLGQFTVTGVLAPSEKTHLTFGMLASMATVTAWKKSQPNDSPLDNWRDHWAACTYVLLKEGTPRQVLDQVLPTTSAQINRLTKTAGPTYRFRAQLLDQISPDYEDLVSITGVAMVSITNLLSFGGLALLILLLAGFNYVNLTLARSLNRAREVGVRKSSGALRSQLISQFLVESAVIALFALGLAYLILIGIEPLPMVQRLMQGTRYDATLWLYFLIFALLTGAVAGLIPARVLSAYQPIQVLRGQVGGPSLRGGIWRKSLIVIQFSVALVGSIVVMTVYRQSAYIATGDHGFNRENILNVRLTEPTAENGKYRTLLNSLSRQAGVERVAAVSESMGHYADGRQLWRQKGGTALSFQAFSVDHQFVPSMGLTLLAGQNLPVSVGDSAGNFILINETAVRELHFANAQQTVGQTVWLNETTPVQVAGVLKDFKYMTAAMKIMPLMLRYEPAQFRVLQVQVADGATERIVPALEKIWQATNPGQELSYGWFEKELYDQHMHWDDQLFFYLLVGMALSIACLGLLGMVTYATEVRTKEVSIRKVMGASVVQMIMLLSRGFIGLLLLAGLIALPLGYTLGGVILQHFAYHVTQGVELVIGFSAMLLIGGFTIGVKTFRAALANPARNLRSE